jgi:hypothetical protein
MTDKELEKDKILKGMIFTLLEIIKGIFNSKLLINDISVLKKFKNKLDQILIMINNEPNWDDVIENLITMINELRNYIEDTKKKSRGIKL